MDSGLRFRGETLLMDDQARTSAPGQFIDLPEGKVHYEIAGPAKAQPVILVHGFSVPCHIWDPTFAALSAAGFRVLRYDLYGRGYSDRPDVHYNENLFDRQLLNLLTALHLTEPVDLVGLSMGGAISVIFTHRHPDRVRRLVLIDPAGLPQRKAFKTRLAKVPLLGELIMHLWGSNILLGGLQRDLANTAHPPAPAYVAKYRLQMKYRGFKRALLSTMRSGILTGAQAAYAGVGQQHHPVLLIWGRQDRVVPFELSQTVRQLIPQTQFHAIDHAGHIPHYERPNQVNPLVVDFLAR